MQRALEILSIYGFQGATARISKIVTFLMAGLANCHRSYVPTRLIQSEFGGLRGKKFS